MFHIQLRSSTLTRFHPTKRFHMGVASYQGSVTVLDIQSKKPIFKQSRAHNISPCTDICWSPTDPNKLISVGYDFKLNIYDTRQKPIIHQIKEDTPLHSVAISPCGFFCCIGTLAGGLVAYDLRSMRTPVATRKDVHLGPVVRVAFVKPESSAAPAAAPDDPMAARVSDAHRFANILGGGRRSSIGVVGQHRAGTRSSLAYLDARPSLMGRPSLTAITSGGHEDAHNSFNAFLNTNTRVPDAFHSRRESLDMDVRPVRFADWSDSDMSSAGAASRLSGMLMSSSTVVSEQE